MIFNNFFSFHTATKEKILCYNPKNYKKIF